VDGTEIENRSISELAVAIAVVILTHNEESHIARCLASVALFGGRAFVIDSGSRDGTIAEAQRLGATVHHHPWKNYADQFQWALDTIDTDAEWILRLDADEVIESDLAERIRNELPKLPPDIVGVNIDRKHIFMGRWIKQGDRYPLTLLRIFRRGHGRIEQRWMDEHIIVDGGRTVHFAGGFADHNLNDLSFFIDKHNKYATREAATKRCRVAAGGGQTPFQGTVL
jgi:glycosyltransferase involved in cell wall biosynthesis